MPQQKYTRLIFSLCILAAVFYNSWPLGYILNSQTAHSGLASDLEQAGQPYYWLFILGDILTGVCLVAACYVMRFKLRPEISTNVWVTVYVGVFLFGLGTAIATVVPAHCSITTALACGANGSSGLGLDALFSGIGALGLFASLVGASMLSMRYRLNAAVIRATWATLIAWSATGVLFSVFALSSGKAAEAQFVQQLFLVLCGLAFIVIGLNVTSLLRSKSVDS